MGERVQSDSEVLYWDFMLLWDPLHQNCGSMLTYEKCKTKLHIQYCAKVYSPCSLYLSVLYIMSITWKHTYRQWKANVEFEQF